MKLLGWDTSFSKAFSLVALEGEEWDPKICLQWLIDHEQRGCEFFHWYLHQLVDYVGWNIREVDAFIVGVGPGSFTGLRMGITTARTISQSLGKPIVPVSSLQVLAFPLMEFLVKKGKLNNDKILVTRSASYNEYYTLYGDPCDPKEQLFTSEELIRLVQFDREVLIQNKLTQWNCIGDFAVESSSSHLSFSKLYSKIGHGKALGSLGARAFKAGNIFPYQEVHPNYLNLSQAERLNQAKQSLQIS